MGGEELKWRQLTGNEPASISDVVTVSVYSEKTRLKKLMLIMNKSQESMFLVGARN